MNRQLRKLAIALMACYLALFVKLNFLQVIDAKALNDEPGNGRAVVRDFNRPRGDIVTADGRLRRASATENPDLFWAVRGGGGNFGVVTSFEFRAHPIGPRVWFLAAMYPMPEATRILRFLEEFMREAPEELAVLGSLWTTPNDEPIPPEHRRSID